MAKTKKKTEQEKRPETYNPKLSINGSFENVIKAAFVKDKSGK